MRRKAKHLRKMSFKDGVSPDQRSPLPWAFMSRIGEGKWDLSVSMRLKIYIYFLQFLF